MTGEFPDEGLGSDYGPFLKRFEFDLKTKSVKITKEMDKLVELPTINHQYYGKTARYGYMMQLPKSGQITDPNVRKDIQGIGFIKYDMKD